MKRKHAVAAGAGVAALALVFLVHRRMAEAAELEAAEKALAGMEPPAPGATPAPPASVSESIVVAVPPQTVTGPIDGFQMPAKVPTPRPVPVSRLAPMPTLVTRQQPELGPGVLTKKTKPSIKLRTNAQTGYRGVDTSRIALMMGSPRHLPF